MSHLKRRSLSPSQRARVSIALLGFLHPSLYVWAAEPLVTDRPDQTESAVVVPKGSVQVELGWTQEVDDANRLRIESDAVPGTLIRLGLHERVELRLGWAGWVEETVRGVGVALDADGAGDADIGAKVVLRSGETGGPQVAVLFGTSVPTGDDGFTSDAYDPSFRFSIAHDLTARLSLGYNVGMAWETEPDPVLGDDTTAIGQYTVALGIGLSERWGAFVELYGDVPTQDGKPEHAFDGGLTYLVRPNLQLDLAGGVGLSDAASDWFVGVGLSVRLPR